MLNTQLDKKILAWIAENREQILADWMDLVRIPSVNSEAAPLAPYGIQCARALKKAAEYFADRSFTPDVHEAEGYALVNYGNGDKTIGMFGHSDVVPVGDGWLYTEPFTPILRDGTLIGRGASDNKSGIMASLCVMSILRDCGINLNGRLQVFIGSDEEVGMRDISAYVRNEKMPDLSLVPDSQFACSLGEKGILRMWAECGTPLNAILDFRGGNAFNVVLDFAEVTLSSNAALEAQLRAKADGNPAYTLRAKEDGTLLLQARGIAKHAGSPAGSINATVLAASLLLECDALDASDREALKTITDLLTSCYGEGLGIARTDEHFGHLTSANGMVAVEAGKLRVSMDIRYPTSLPGAELEAILHRVWNSRGWQIVYMYNREGFQESPDGIVPRVMQEVYYDVTGIEAKPYYMSGGTYARYLKNAYAVGVWAKDINRTTPKMEFPAGHGSAHQRDEGIDVDGFFQAVRVLTHAVVTLDRQLYARQG